jgi:hypothetical protein
MSEEIVYEANYAANILGTTVEAVIESVNKPGYENLFGVTVGGKVYVAAWELEGQRKAMHQRLLPSVADAHK